MTEKYSHEAELERFVENELDEIYIDDPDLIWGPTIEGKANALHNILEYVKENYAPKY